MPDEKQLRLIIREELAATNARWLNTKVAEKYVGGTRTLQHMREDGLHSVRVGGMLKFDKMEIDERMESLKR